MQPTHAAGQLQVVLLVLVLVEVPCQAPSATTATSATFNPRQRSLKTSSKQQLRQGQQEVGSSSSVS